MKWTPCGQKTPPRASSASYPHSSGRAASDQWAFGLHGWIVRNPVDELCSWEVQGQKVRPKVIASTATIRRAPDQVRKLFLRKLEVFPPQGTDIADRFLSIRRETSVDSPGRRYLGNSAFGRRYPVTLIRVYVAFMGAAQALYSKYDRLADPWMTLAGYFNSICEIAGTRRLVEDDIRARLRDADQRRLVKRQIRLGTVEELTSRKSGTDIPKILERLEIIFDKTLEAQRQADRAAKRPVQIPDPYDVVLATNMISVGVDIDRLGLMVVAGQPKTTSEYIQATSRVGRSAAGPGLVCTVYNWARPQDLSHYETFEHYHDTFHKHVEALSVTPFSPRALDRGLSGILVGLMRLWEERLNANQKAGALTDTDPLMPEVFDRIVRRAENATEDATAGGLVRQMLEQRRDYWLSRIRNATDYRLGYQDEAKAVVGLLDQAGKDDWDTRYCREIIEDRLMAALQRRLGGQMSKLYLPPIQFEDVGWNVAVLPVGVPVCPSHGGCAARSVTHWPASNPGPSNCNLTAIGPTGLAMCIPDAQKPIIRRLFLFDSCWSVKKGTSAISLGVSTFTLG
jgi:Helicase conserved C-terminal domain